VGGESLKIKIQKSKFKIKELFFISFTFYILHFAFLLFPLHSYGDLEKILQNLEEKQKAVETWEADFIQAKVVSIMASKIISEGHTYFKKPNLIHWRYTKGSSLLMIFNSDEAWLYYPNLKEAERYRNIERVIRRFPLAFGLDIKDLRKYWEITLMPSPEDEIVSLELRPKEGKEKRIFERMILWIDENKGAPKRVQILEPGGDSTLIEFKNIKLNQKLPGDLFIFKPPEGVKVTTPLE
jgi:outer membrane lipoprotein-sorting protein